MSLQIQSIPAMYGGVSQQSAVSRSVNQCEEAINTFFSIAKGAYKRQPLEQLMELTTGDLEDAFVDWMLGPDNEWYVILIPGDGTLRVHRTSDAAFISISDTSLSNMDYLNSAGPARDAFRATMFNDKLFIVNTEVTATLTTATTAGTLAGTVQTLQDDSLDAASSGAIYSIMGTDFGVFNGYYAKKVGDHWVEWTEPGIPFEIDNTTMPHVVRLVEDGVDPNGIQAIYERETWADRGVGDPESNKAPSFIGNTINSLSFNRDRLVILSGKGFSASRVKEPTNFWRSSVTQVLDDDRIDSEVNETDLSGLNWLASVSGFGVLFSNDRQFTLDGQPALTPGTATVNPVTRFPASKRVEPVVSGSNVFFASNAGDNTHVREMFVEEESVTLDAANINSHAFAYVPKNVRTMEVHSHYDHILLATDEDPGTIYSYQFHWVGNEKVVSAWGRHPLSGNVAVVSMKQIGRYIFVVYQSVGTYQGLFLGRIDLKPESSDPGFNHKVHIDQQLRLTGQFNSAENRTVFSSPFPILETLDLPTSDSGGQGDSVGGDPAQTVPVTGRTTAGGDPIVTVDLGAINPPSLNEGDTAKILKDDSSLMLEAVVVSISSTSSAIFIQFDAAVPADWTDFSFGVVLEIPGTESPAPVSPRVDLDGLYGLSNPVEVVRPVMVRGQGSSNKGVMVNITEMPEYQPISDFQFALTGDWSGEEVYLGLTYPMAYRFSEQFFQNGETRALNVRLQLRNLQVHFTDTAFFRVLVKSRGRELQSMSIFPFYKHTYTARTLNDEWFSLNRPEQTTGVFNSPVMGKASDTTIELVNDSYMPSNFQAAEWRGLISRRMTR